MPLSLLWLLVWIFQYQGINQEIAEKSQSKGETCLVSSQDWQSEIEFVKSGGNSTKTQYTPFEGRKSDQPYFKGNHGDLRALEVQVLQKDIKGVCKWLQPVPDTMAGVSGHRIRPSYPSTGLELEVPSRVGPKSTQPTHGKGNRGKSQQPKSPRHGHKGRGKGGGYKAGKGDGSHQQGKQTGKGKVPSQNMDKGKGKGETMVPPEPPWTPTLHPSSLPLPPPTTPPPPPSAEETTLKELIHALKKSQQDMDPEVQAILQRSHMKEGQKSTQSLYSAVDDLSTARETLDIAKLARHNLHIKWRNFLTDAVQRWQKHTEDFQREESELTQQIEAAKTSLAAAVRRFENSKSELGVQVIDVEAQAAMEEAAADVSAGVTVGTALFDSLVTMRSQLETVQASAEAMVTEEANSSNKRQRVEEGFVQSAPLSGGGMPSPSAPAMQAFPKREPKENQDSHFPPPDKS